MPWYIYPIAVIVILGIGVYFAPKIRRWLKKERTEAVEFGKEKYNDAKEHLPKW